jgi:hypothetical protein
MESRPTTAPCEQRLTELVTYRTAGNGWLRHKKPETEPERLLGVWLHVQRINALKGKMDPAREAKLNDLVPGWRKAGNATAAKQTTGQHTSWQVGTGIPAGR